MDKKMANKLGIRSIILFGSQVSGRAGDDSDVDVAVEMDHRPDYKDFKKVYNFLTDHIEGKLDVRFLNEADSLFRYQVMKNGKLLLGDERDFVANKILAHKIYVDDVLPYTGLQFQMAKNKQAGL